MFKKVLEYAGEYRKTTYASMAVMLIGIVMNVLPFLFLYQLMEPLLLHENVEVWYVVWRVLAIGICGVLYALFYVKGLALSHRAAYKTLRNLRSSLQGKLERQPLGTIQEKGVGTLKKMFIDDIDSIELLLAHALPEGLSNVAVPLFVFIAMFFADWKLALLSLCALPLGLIAMGAMYKAGTSKMGAYYASAQKMNNTIVEYINGMEVVKVFNRDGESTNGLSRMCGATGISRWPGTRSAGPGWRCITASSPAWPCSPCPSGPIWCFPALPRCRIWPWCSACPSARGRRCCGL